MEYVKHLSRPEARHRYWHIYKADRDFFPESDVTFNLLFHGKNYRLRVNHKGDIMTGHIYEYRFLEGDRMTITRKGNLEYHLEAPETKPYS